MPPLLALTHPPSPQLTAGERTFVELEPIDYGRACQQHAAYEALLRSLGVIVRTLGGNEQFPDGTFVEDAAVVLDELAILAAPGAASRRGETAALAPVLAEYRPVARLEPPAQLDGGDVLRIGRTLLVGRSRRTNEAGIVALGALVRPFGYAVHAVPVTGCLHLKTACTALPDGRLLVRREWLDVRALDDFHLIDVPLTEPWAANILLVDDTVVLPQAHPETATLVERLGFSPRTVDISEFAKAEGGVTCLSVLLNLCVPLALASGCNLPERVA